MIVLNFLVLPIALYGELNKTCEGKCNRQCKLTTFCANPVTADLSKVKYSLMMETLKNSYSYIIHFLLYDMAKEQRWRGKPKDVNWEDQLRIMRAMYELIGKQNGAAVEKCLEEIARHVSRKEKRIYSVAEIEAVYERTTSGKLRTEIKFAQRTPLDLIRSRTEAIRNQYSFNQGFHYDDLERDGEKEKEGLYELFKRKRVEF